MKKILIMLSVFAFASTAFAHKPKHPRKFKKSVTVVKGKRALAIYEALDAEILTLNRPRATVEMKKVAGLRCAKIIKKADSKQKFRCVLKGKKPNRNWRQRRQQRRNRQGQSQGQQATVDLLIVDLD